MLSKIALARRGCVGNYTKKEYSYIHALDATLIVLIFSAVNAGLTTRERSRWAARRLSARAMHSRKVRSWAGIVAPSRVMTRAVLIAPSAPQLRCASRFHAVTHSSRVRMRPLYDAEASHAIFIMARPSELLQRRNSKSVPPADLDNSLSTPDSKCSRCTTDAAMTALSRSKHARTGH